MNLNKSTLEQFTGTQQWHRFNRLTPNILLTDGALYVAKEGGAFWLMDIIASVQPHKKIKDIYFQTWQIQVNEDKSATVWAEDGNGNKLYSQDIPWTDFSLDTIKLFAIREDDHTVILLPSEY